MREKQRNELHKTIWSIANELRGSVDGWDFKAYVLITLFLPLYQRRHHKLHQRPRSARL